MLEYRDHDASQSANAAAMLRSSVMVRRAQRAFLAGRRDYEAALQEGICENRAYYGARLAGSLAAHLQTGQWRRGMPELLALVRYDPRRFVSRALGRRR